MVFGTHICEFLVRWAWRCLPYLDRLLFGSVIVMESRRLPALNGTLQNSLGIKTKTSVNFGLGMRGEDRTSLERSNVMPNRADKGKAFLINNLSYSLVASYTMEINARLTIRDW